MDVTDEIYLIDDEMKVVAATLEDLNEVIQWYNKSIVALESRLGDLKDAKYNIKVKDLLGKYLSEGIELDKNNNPVHVKVHKVIHINNHGVLACVSAAITGDYTGFYGPTYIYKITDDFKEITEREFLDYAGVALVKTFNKANVIVTGIEFLSHEQEGKISRISS